MKKFLSKLIAAGLCTTMLSFVPAPAFAANDDDRITVSKVVAGNAYIPEDTEIEVEITEDISSKTAEAGDRISMKLVSNLIINNVIVAPAGTKVKGEVARKRKAGGFGRGGKLEIKIISFKTLNNVEVPLEFSKTAKGGKDSGAVAMAAVLSIAGGFFMKGKNVIIEKGTRFTTVVADDTDLNVPIRGLSYAMHN